MKIVVDAEVTLPYYVKQIEKVENGKGYWNSEKIGIFNEKDEKIGEYVRNYPSFGGLTFYPFIRDGKWYALYSKDYTCSAIMSLPDCKEIWTETPDWAGFCPTEFYVPLQYDLEENIPLDCKNNILDTNEWNDKKWSHYFPNFGFVSGCIWGDDSGGWKLEVIDFKDIAKPSRTQPFGYCELANQLMREGAVSLDYGMLKIARPSRFKVKDGQFTEMKDY